ncbi:MAG TPA: hypothetical protein VG900_09840 [Hyphomicrobiaceae bacterium]|jgi:hypothetical protein|nr:hypothetical protein [Hyphomicrobiaceae bacterium]
MAKLTRKLWAGIGVATLTGVAFAPQAIAQDHGHAAPAKAAATPDAGGEAYLTDGGPRDTRIRFYRDIELMRGHLLVGGQLIALGLWDEALPHFLHPTEELYGLMEKYIKLHHITPFRRDLQVLAQAVKAKRRGAYDQALKVVDRRLAGALDVARGFMHPPLKFTVRAAVEVLKAAHSEYEESMEGGRFVKPVEYQDSRGFVWQAESMFEGAAKALARADAASLEKIRADVAKLKTAWPAPMPPSAPVLQAGDVASLIADIEQHIARY